MWQGLFNYTMGWWVKKGLLGKYEMGGVNYIMWGG